MNSLKYYFYVLNFIFINKWTEKMNNSIFLYSFFESRMQL
ncbi:hypothetical protein CCAN11_1900016 [Capnocytophaga canimorsus]|uniref:Uncharacterized protein n=1 Tax=Capnocytophaga canimorsus TaxID=28188 RepID=A0A0B7IBY9_9FLAO|nr:hypothetical protein CCAN11_1900016 [Capnocytophaga canimorsus]